MARGRTELLALAAKQHGVLTRSQALELGVTGSTFHRDVEQGLFEQVDRGVYRVAGSSGGLRADAMAAVLTIGGLTAASHATAAWLHGLAEPPRAIEVVTTRPGRRLRDFVLHQSTDLITSHVTQIDSIPTTTVARTIVDIGIPHGLGVAGHCLDEARRRGLVDLEAVAELRASVARQGRNGVGPAKIIIAQRSEWDGATDSVLEDRFARLIQSYGLPMPLSQHRVRDEAGKILARVDFAFPDQKIAIELDGAAYHNDMESFQKDRVRQNSLVLMGWTVLRFTFWDLLAEDRVADTIHAALTRNTSRKSRI